MRTIKFRGIRKDDFELYGKREWCYGFLVPYVSRKDEQLYLMEKVTGSSVYGLPVLADTIGQFTGLCDKNGRGVWEGDIVRYRTTDLRFKKNPKYSVLAIHYDESTARFMAGNIYWENLKSDRLEVIGNIHDNPKLLTK